MVFQSGCGRCLAGMDWIGCCPNSLPSSSSSLQSSGNGQLIPAAAARSRYSWTVLRPIRQLRAICRCPNPNSNLNRRTSLTFRMDDLLAGTLFSFMHGVSMPGNCPAWLRPSAARLWKTFRSKPNTIPVDGRKCSPSHRNGVRLHNGMLFGFTTEWCSPSQRNRVRLRPDSPLNLHAVELSHASCVFCTSEPVSVETQVSRMLKHKHHYVNRFYLEPWMRDAKIACWLRGKIVQPSLEGVANQRDFYEVPDLHPEDVTVIR